MTAQGTADVYLVNSQQCSAGCGPGYASLPWAEAKALVDAGYAIWGNHAAAGRGGHLRAGDRAVSRPSFEGASNAADPPVPPAPAGEDGELAEVLLTVAVRTSAGPGPGVRRVPAVEAASLVGRRLAVYGDQPPRGWNLEAG